MITEMSLTFGIKTKTDIESLMGSSDLIPEQELHVQRGTTCAKRLSGIDSTVSVALVAKADRRFGCSSYTIGYIATAKVVFNDVQVKPLMINHGMVQRAVKEFTDNEVYPTYEIVVVSPPMDLFEFGECRGTLAPYAAPSRAYRKNKR